MDMYQVFETWGVFAGITTLIIFMFFIIWDLAKSSNAGRVGAALMFVTLGAGMFGFVIKVAIQASMEMGVS